MTEIKFAVGSRPLCVEHPRVVLRLLLCLLLTAWVEARPNSTLTLASLRELAGRTRLESKRTYLKDAAAARALFANQGGLVDLDPGLPTVLLPDLHAQRDYLLQVLALKIGGQTVLDLLRRDRLQLVCMGDGMHAENRALQRWLQSERELAVGSTSPSMEAEMVESLGLMRMAFQLKVAFPRQFYWVRGNHEDMDPDFPYRKFTKSESELVKKWIQHKFGEDFLSQWHACEQAMPLVARGGSFVASHSPPERLLTLDAIRQRTREAFHACTWSDNTLWRPGSSEERAFAANCQLLGASPERPWLCGHRKVEGALYRSQCGGMLIQINPLDSAPRVYILAPVRGKKFDAASMVHRL